MIVPLMLTLLAFFTAMQKACALDEAADLGVWRKAAARPSTQHRESITANLRKSTFTNATVAVKTQLADITWCSNSYDSYSLQHVSEYCCLLHEAVLGVGHHCWAQFDIETGGVTSISAVSLTDLSGTSTVHCFDYETENPDGICKGERFLSRAKTDVSIQATMSTLQQYTSDYLDKNPKYSWESQNCQLYSVTIFAHFSGNQMWTDNVRPYETGCSSCWSCPAPTIYPFSGCPIDCGAKCDGQPFGGPCCKTGSSLEQLQETLTHQKFDEHAENAVKLQGGAAKMFADDLGNMAKKPVKDTEDVLLKVTHNLQQGFNDNKEEEIVV